MEAGDGQSALINDSCRLPLLPVGSFGYMFFGLLLEWVV